MWCVVGEPWAGMGLEPSGAGASCSIPVAHSSSALCGISSSAFFLLAHALYISSPESWRNLSDDLSSCHVPTGRAQPQGLLVILWMGLPWTGACYPHPSTLLPTLLRVRSCYNQRGSSPVCSASRAVLGLMMLVDAWTGCRLSGPGSKGLVQLLNWNWKNKITPNGTPFLKSFLDKVRSGLFDFHQGEKVCPHRVAFIL